MSLLILYLINSTQLRPKYRIKACDAYSEYCVQKRWFIFWFTINKSYSIEACESAIKANTLERVFYNSKGEKYVP